MKLMGHMLDYILDHMLDHMNKGLVTIFNNSIILIYLK